MKKLIIALLLTASAAHAEEPMHRTARQLYDWMEAARPRINRAGEQGDRVKLTQIRGEVAAKMSRWPRGPEIDPYHACGMALADMQIFLTAAIDKQPRKERDRLSGLFRQDLAECRRLVRP